MRKWFLVLMVCLCLTLSGCPNTTPAQRVETLQATITQTSNLSQKLGDSVGELKSTIATFQLMLADPNIPPEMKPKILENLNLATAKLDTFIEQKQKIDDILAKATAVLNSADLNNMDVQKEIQTYGAAAQAIALSLPPPWNAYAYIAVAFGVPFAGFLLTWLSKKKTLEKLNDSKFVNTEIVSSVNTLLNPIENNGAIAADKIGDAKQVLKDGQSDFTRSAVKDINNPMINTGPDPK